MATSPAAGNPERWLEEHGDALYRYALMRLRDPEAAEEAVQETFLAGLRARQSFEGRSSERTWLIGILKRKVVDHFRRSGRERPASELASGPDGDAFVEDLFDRRDHWRQGPRPWLHPRDALSEKDFFRVLSGCMEALPARLADAFALRVFDECPTEEICDALELTATNLGSILHRARLRLRHCLEMHWFGLPRKRRGKTDEIVS